MVGPVVHGHCGCSHVWQRAGQELPSQDRMELEMHGHGTISSMCVTMFLV